MQTVKFAMARVNRRRAKYPSKGIHMRSMVVHSRGLMASVIAK